MLSTNHKLVVDEALVVAVEASKVDQVGSDLLLVQTGCQVRPQRLLKYLNFNTSSMEHWHPTADRRPSFFKRLDSHSHLIKLNNFLKYF